MKVVSIDNRWYIIYKWYYTTVYQKTSKALSDLNQNQPATQQRIQRPRLVVFFQCYSLHGMGSRSCANISSTCHFTEKMLNRDKNTGHKAQLTPVWCFKWSSIRYEKFMIRKKTGILRKSPGPANPIMNPSANDGHEIWAIWFQISAMSFVSYFFSGFVCWKCHTIDSF
jgi:hypothetical protein